MTQTSPGPGSGNPPPFKGRKKTHPGVIITFIVVALGAISGGFYLYSSASQKDEAAPSSSASSSQADDVRETVAAPVRKTDQASQKEEAAPSPPATSAKEESPTAESVAVEDVPVDVDFSRQCRDDVTIADCRSTTVEELSKCGFCQDGKCTNGVSSVRLVCESLALIQYAQMIVEAGKGTVNLCDCQTQRVSAPSASE